MTVGSIKKSLPFIALFLAIVFSIFYRLPSLSDDNDREEISGAEVTKIVEVLDDGDRYRQTLELKSNEEGNAATITLTNDESYSVNKRIFKVGDRVMLSMVAETGDYYILDYDRSFILIWLFFLFITVVIIVAGWQGLGALIGMAFSFLVIFKFVLPLILLGNSPVIIAILGALFIIPATFYSSHGLNRKTTVAMISTFLTLLIAGILSTAFADWGNLSGLASESTTFLKIGTATKIDFKGLVLAGMIISILGILDDITISQASVVRQLKAAQPDLNFARLYWHAMKVGRDHISSMVNTLILVYTGASLPLLLLFLDQSQQFSTIINLEFISEEVIRTLVGSISLILAVPITTLLASLAIGKIKHGEADKASCHAHH